MLLSTGFTSGAWAQPIRVPASLVTDAGPANGVAIWVHPQDVARSAVLVAEGDAGVALYALDGGLVRRALVGGVVTDVDVAHAPPAALNASSLVLAVDAENRELLLYTVDP
ncbi:MAG: phytase, partial [Myxococcaceae bacterium]|nr:phytase [Myxococcaceae bacterium]